MPWLGDVEDEIRSYMELGPNWDSYGGGPAHGEVVDGAAVIVDIVARIGFSRPGVSPESSGGILLEWEQDARALIVDLTASVGSPSCTKRAERMRWKGTLRTSLDCWRPGCGHSESVEAGHGRSDRDRWQQDGAVVGGSATYCVRRWAGIGARVGPEKYATGQSP